MLRSLFFIVSSAALYTLPAVAPITCWWMILIFLVPFFWYSQRPTLPFFAGFVWSVLCLLGQSFAELPAVFAATPMYTSTIILFAGLFIIYVGTCGGIILWVTQVIVRRCAHISCGYQALSLLMWTLAPWLFLVWLSSYCLWPCGRAEGIHLAHPSIYLAYYPLLIQPIAFIARHWFLALLIFWQALIAQAFIKPTKTTMFTIVLMPTLWLLCGLRIPTIDPIPAWLKQVAIVPRYVDHHVCLSRTTHTIALYLNAISQRHPDISLVIFPEDALQTTHIADNALIAPPSLPSSLVHVILGAYRRESSKLYNTAYWLHNGTIRQWYDKRHVMAFTEALPPICTAILPHTVTSYTPLSCSDILRPTFSIDNIAPLCPYICSELFFNNYPDDSCDNTTIIALCSDKWSRYAHSSYRMLLAAQVRAVEWHRDILYAAYHHHGYITKYGTLYPTADIHNELSTVDTERAELVKIQGQKEQDFTELSYSKKTIRVCRCEENISFALTGTVHHYEIICLHPPHTNDAISIHGIHSTANTIDWFFDDSDTITYLDTTAYAPLYTVYLDVLGCIHITAPETSQKLIACKKR